MKVICIAAVARNGVIGDGLELPWHIPEDLRYFRKATEGHAIIMGRRTWDSLQGEPLEERYNIVVTSDYETKGDVSVPSIAKAIVTANTLGYDKAFIVGGAEIYKASLPICDEIYLTRLNMDASGDVTCPELIEDFNDHFYLKSTEPGKGLYPFDYHWEVWVRHGR